MTITKYALRHIATGKFMPNSNSGKGWSFWNPDSVSPRQGMDNAMPGSVRLFDSNKGADNARVAWARGESDYQAFYVGTPDYEDRLKFKDVGRKKDMLEVVQMTLRETQSKLAFKAETDYGVVPSKDMKPLRSGQHLLLPPEAFKAVNEVKAVDDGTAVVELRMPAAHAKLLLALPPGVIELILEVAATPLFKERSKELLPKQTAVYEHVGWMKPGKFGVLDLCDKNDLPAGPAVWMQKVYTKAGEKPEPAHHDDPQAPFGQRILG